MQTCIQVNKFHTRRVKGASEKDIFRFNFWNSLFEIESQKKYLFWRMHGLIAHLQFTFCPLSHHNHICIRNASFSGFKRIDWHMDTRMLDIWRKNAQWTFEIMEATNFEIKWQMLMHLMLLKILNINLRHTLKNIYYLSFIELKSFMEGLHYAAIMVLFYLSFI